PRARLVMNTAAGAVGCDIFDANFEVNKFNSRDGGGCCHERLGVLR
ncbi:MAG: hypothetical protein ACI9W2_005301, partial [Gammaproteobacteria bacterium]